VTLPDNVFFVKITIELQNYINPEMANDCQECIVVESNLLRHSTDLGLNDKHGKSTYAGIHGSYVAKHIKSITKTVTVMCMSFHLPGKPKATAPCLKYFLSQRIVQKRANDELMQCLYLKWSRGYNVDLRSPDISRGYEFKRGLKTWLFECVYA
jgi:hypothetical protein